MLQPLRVLLPLCVVLLRGPRTRGPCQWVLVLEIKYTERFCILVSKLVRFISHMVISPQSSPVAPVCQSSELCNLRPGRDTDSITGDS